MRRLLDLLRRRRYTSSKQKETFSKDLKDLRKGIKEKIKTQNKIHSTNHTLEKQQRVEMEVLLNVLSEDPEFYTQSEITKIVSEII